jgi:hypothetical protein
MHTLTATAPLPAGQPMWFLAHRLVEPGDWPPYLEGVYAHPATWPRMPGQLRLRAERTIGNNPHLDITAWQVDADGHLEAEPFASWRLPDAWGWTTAITPTLAAHRAHRRRQPFDHLRSRPHQPTNPPETWGVRGIDGPIRAIVDVTVEPVTADRSRLTIAVDFTGHGMGKLLVPLVVRREAAREMPTNLAALRQNLEHR